MTSTKSLRMTLVAAFAAVALAPAAALADNPVQFTFGEDHYTFMAPDLNDDDKGKR